MLQQGSRALAEVLPNAQPVLAEFLTAETDAASGEVRTATA